MKTYIVKRTYGDDLKVTVEDNIYFSFYARDNHEGCEVNFYEEGNKEDYNRGNFVAAFDNVKSVYLDTLDIQVKKVQYKTVPAYVDEDEGAEVWVKI